MVGHVVKRGERKVRTGGRTSYIDDKGMKWDGNNCDTILPIRTAVEVFHRKQLETLEETVEQEQIAGLLTATSKGPL